MTTLHHIPVRAGAARGAIRVGVSTAALLATRLRRERRRVVVVTEPRVHRAWWRETREVLRAHGIDVGPPLLLPTGEAAKSLRTLEWKSRLPFNRTGGSGMSVTWMVAVTEYDSLSITLTVPANALLT